MGDGIGDGIRDGWGLMKIIGVREKDGSGERGDYYLIGKGRKRGWGKG